MAVKDPWAGAGLMLPSPLMTFQRLGTLELIQSGSEYIHVSESCVESSQLRGGLFGGFAGRVEASDTPLGAV